MTDRTPSLTYTAFERSLLERNRELERRIVGMEEL